MRYNTNQININYPSSLISSGDNITSGEFFAGGGGWTNGMKKVPGIKTKWLLNHDKVAISVNAFHHPDTKIYWSDIYVQDEHELEYVDHIHASIECQFHSQAKGGEEKDLGSYTMGWELHRYFVYLQPLVLTVENVPEFKKWAPTDEENNPIPGREGEEFERWKNAFIALGYEYTESIRCAADDGIPTTRRRYFGVFHRPGLNFRWPAPTHSETGEGNLEKWIACKEHIDLTNQGESIFGRQFNENLPKNHRRPLVKNSLKRIGYGIIKYAPDISAFLSHYCYSHDRVQSLLSPISTITQKNRHQLITIEKLNFIADYCRADLYQKTDKPLKTQLTWQTKTLVSIEHLLLQYYGSMNGQTLDEPIKTIVCRDLHQLIRIEKMQFIAKYMNSNGNPQSNLQTIDKPLSTIMTREKHQLVTLLDNFDIKARFLSAEELAALTTFPRDYFKREGLKISNKNAIKMIGNALSRYSWLL